jgi:hypothetical protein
MIAILIEQSSSSVAMAPSQYPERVNPACSPLVVYTSDAHLAGNTVTLDWAACALIMASASMVMALAGFGNALVAMAFLPYFMPPATAIAVLMIYTVVFTIAIFVRVRRHLSPRGVTRLLVGTVLGTPLGVWILVAC